MKIGFELECVSHESRDSLRKHLLSVGVKITKIREDFSAWQVGNDASIGRASLFHTRVELRSPIFEFTEFVSEDVLNVLKILQPRCYVNGTCGLHFHVSGIQFNVPAIKKKLCEFKDLGNRYRMEHYARTNVPSFTKHCIIREVGKNHIEFRHFNSTLNLRGFCQSWKIVRRTILQVNGEPASENTEFSS